MDIGMVKFIARKEMSKGISVGITNILPKGNSLVFVLSNGTNIEYSLNGLNFMKLSDFDKDNDNVIDIANYCNLAKESTLSKDSEKLGNKLPSFYFQKEVDNSDNIIEGNNKFITQSDKDKIANIPINTNVEINKKMDKTIYDSNNSGIIDKAETLEGLIVSIADLNKLLGIKSNVQTQLDALSHALTIKQVLQTYASLIAITTKNSGDAYIITTDESAQGKNLKTWYVWNGSEWLFLGAMTAEVRNFLLNPLNLSTETTGILPQSKVDLNGIAKISDLHNHINKALLDSYSQTDSDLKDSVSKKHEHINKGTLEKLTTSAEGKLLYNGNLIEGSGLGATDLSKYYNKTEIDNITGKETLTTISQTLKGAINEVKQASFQNGVNAKNKVVTALTSRGMNVTTNNTFAELADAIITLTLPPSTLQTTKLNCILGEKKIIDYGRDLSDYKFATSVLKFQPGTLGVSNKICSYNNADNTNFIYDVNKTIFDGKMKPKNDFIINYSDSRILGEKTEYSYHIKKSDYKNIEGFVNNNDNTLTAKATMPSYVIQGKGDINIKNIQKLKKINLNMSRYKVLLSFDSGVTWKSYYNSAWITVDIVNLADVKLKAMDKTLLDTLTDMQLEVVRSGSNIIKFAYYQEQNNINDVLYSDELDLVVDMQGMDVLANQSDWSYKMCADNMGIEYTFNVAGTFTINRI